MDIIAEIKESFRKGSALTRLIYVNLAVFIVVKVMHSIFFLTGTTASGLDIIYNNLALRSNLHYILLKPWTIISYMFFHMDFMHILFNLLTFYWFGQIFLQYFNGKQLLSLYLVGGIAGGILYVLAYNVLPILAGDVVDPRALGASAAIMAVVFAISFAKPDYIFNLMFIGPVRIIYIALFFVLIDIITLPDGNFGGKIAHLGGAIMGYLYATQLKQRRDILYSFTRLIEFFVQLVKPKPKVKMTYRKTADDFEYNKHKKTEQEEIDKILDKIAQTGYDKLSKEEKDMLFRAGKK